MKEMLFDNFECVFLSVDGYCMNKSDLDWIKCDKCEKTDNCEYCLFDGVKCDTSFCSNCEFKKEG